MSLTLSELSRRINGALLDDSSIAIKRIAPLDRALPGDLSFLSNTRFRAQLRRCRASAIIVDRASLSYCVGEPLLVDDLLIGCARAASSLEHASRINGVRRRRSQDYEIVDPSADLASSVTVGRSVTIGAHSTIGPGCVIGDGVRFGSYCRLGPNITLAAAASLGNRVCVGANSSLGGEPFLYVKDR